MPTLIGSPVAAAPEEPATVPLGAAVVLSVVDAPGVPQATSSTVAAAATASRVRDLGPVDRGRLISVCPPRRGVRAAHTRCGRRDPAVGSAQTLRELGRPTHVPAEHFPGINDGETSHVNEVPDQAVDRSRYCSR